VGVFGGARHRDFEMTLRIEQAYMLKGINPT
jgi:hypothetical protein